MKDLIVIITGCIILISWLIVLTAISHWTDEASKRCYKVAMIITYIGSLLITITLTLL